MKNLAVILMGLGCGLTLTGWSISAQAATLVDLEIAFILDGSDSIPASNFNTQLSAYNQIFTAPNFYATRIQPLLGQTLPPDGKVGLGKIAVSVFQFGTTVQQSIGWTVIANQADATAFGNLFLSIPKVGGLTSLGGGIQAATQSITSNAFDSSYQILDLSSDGLDDPGPGLEIFPVFAALQAQNAGVDVLNIISTPVRNEELLENLIFGQNLNGSDALLLTGDSISEYQTLLTEKIETELSITSTPEPNLVLALLSLGLLGARVKLKTVNSES